MRTMAGFLKSRARATYALRALAGTISERMAISSMRGSGSSWWMGGVLAYGLFREGHGRRGCGVDLGECERAAKLVLPASVPVVRQNTRGGVREAFFEPLQLHVIASNHQALGVRELL